MTPFDVEETTYYKVIELFADLRSMQIREEKKNDPDRVIKRPAGDDWF
jgi:hypothetical protein